MHYLLHYANDSKHTEPPVQNIGHDVQGSSLALASQVERYGFRTMSGSTGGVSVDAVLSLLSTLAARAVTATARMLDIGGRTHRQAIGRSVL